METELVVKHIVNWLKEYAEKSKVNGFVIGISGGIDSAVTSALCAKTGFPVLCIEMPIHQAASQINRALNHIKWLQQNYPKVSTETIPLTTVFDQLIAAFPTVENNEKEMMALVNTRARLRMTTLYYFAALHGYLVAGTGNKVEDFGIGFFTKYGDGGVDISPIADLLKTEVYEIANHLGINTEIINAAPTDGLWGDDRTDEDQIGASYPELEWAMKMSENGKTQADFKGREKEIMLIYTKLHKANKHKMTPIPTCEIPLGLR